MILVGDEQGISLSGFFCSNAFPGLAGDTADNLSAFGAFPARFWPIEGPHMGKSLSEIAYLRPENRKNIAYLRPV